jgi:Uma2 family endonuclease
LALETTFRLDEDAFLEPDFIFYRTSTGLVNLRPENALLTIELSDSSLEYDLGRKARLYVSFGIRELWVVDAVKLVTHIHRRPGIEGYEENPLLRRMTSSRLLLSLSRPLSARWTWFNPSFVALTFLANPRRERPMTFILVVGSRTAGAG